MWETRETPAVVDVLVVSTVSPRNVLVEANELAPQIITEEIELLSALKSFSTQVPLFSLANAFTIDSRIAVRGPFVVASSSAVMQWLRVADFPPETTVFSHKPGRILSCASTRNGLQNATTVRVSRAVDLIMDFLVSLPPVNWRQGLRSLVFHTFAVAAAGRR